MIGGRLILGTPSHIQSDLAITVVKKFKETQQVMVFQFQLASVGLRFPVRRCQNQQCLSLPSCNNFASTYSETQKLWWQLAPLKREMQKGWQTALILVQALLNPVLYG